MSSKLPELALLGNPVLREISKHIENVLSVENQNFFDTMIECLLDRSSLIGIAAPQISHSLRCFVYHIPLNPQLPERKIISPTVIINPLIINSSEKIIKDQERCLSIPGIRGFVPRHESIHVQYVTRDNIQHEETLSGFLAKLFQHEIDHLDGLVYLDRLESTRDIISEEEFQMLVAG